jgi:hypothetical protein
MGVSPATVMVSAIVPTRMSTLMVMTPDPLTSMDSRRTVLNPVRVKVT